MKNLLVLSQKISEKLSPQQNLLIGFSIYTLVGSILLCLPLMQKQSVSFLDNLFISASAISTTGLATVSVSDSYNIIGQLVILLLIQIGGVGYMTFSSFVILSRKGNITQWHHKVLNAEFSMPKGFHIIDFLKSVIIFTILIEAIGALALYIAFINAGVEHNFAIWSSIFHSISSFCTAGFGLYNDSFERFADNSSINIIVSILSILGSLGFIVFTDFWNKWSGKAQHITFTTKIIFLVIILLLTLGTILFYFFEPSVTGSFHHKIMASFFQTMTALTTVGFNTIPIGNLSLPLIMIVVFLMYVGASPSGTGGGVKSTTITALTAIMWSRIRGSRSVAFLGKTIPLERLYVATSVFMIYATVLFVSTLFLTFTEKFQLHQSLFEATSAIGTVGLSTGITASLSNMGKLNLIIVMFIGRLGVLTFGLAIFAKINSSKKATINEDLAV